jgi:phosphoribosylamine-glycine ligase
LLAGASATAPATVLLIGGGGREHAIALSLAKSSRVARVVVAPGNGGTASAGGKVSNLPFPLDVTDHAAVVACAKGEGASLVVVGPEDPLADGLADACAAAGLPCFGPSKAAAQLEASKAFSKNFMAKHGLPTAQFATFTDQAAALAYAEQVNV